MSSNNSAAGPDGIPFSVYRACAAFDPSIARVLADITAELGRGVLPPPGYNHARFFLIPKKGGGLIADTRGISVTNADNRLQAGVVAKLITPAVQYLSQKSQKGFVPGRQGTDHVHALTQNFFSKLDRKQQLHVMLIDMRRAFDSVAHTFIHACLKHVNFCEWFCKLVTSLLYQVLVIPVLAVLTRHRVSIKRGVKQGCPLSPLLFIICIDFLLHSLDKLSRTEIYGYADDIALATRSVSNILRALRLIAAFSRFSDLHINAKKTAIVSTRPPSTTTRARLDREGWKDILFVDRAKYLGLIFGPKVSTVDIFAEAMAKFGRRADLYSPVIRSCSLHARIVIFNTFLLPLFYYLAQFLIIPYPQVCAPVMALAHRWIVPYNGGGWGYAHLSPRRDMFGPHTPLKDLWSINMAFLAAPFPLEDSHRQPLPVMGDYSRVTKFDWRGTPNPSDHQAYAGFVLLEDHAPRRHGLIDLGKLPPPDKTRARRAWVYHQFVMSDRRKERESPKSKTSLPSKLGRLLGHPPDKAYMIHIRAHAKLVAKLVTPAKWNTFLRLVFNALPFDVRRKAAQMEVRRGGERRLLLSCYLCGAGEDSVRHVYGECAVVRRARAQVAEAADCELGDTLEHATLVTPPPSRTLPSLLTVVFNWTVWHLRTAFFRTLSTPPLYSQAAQKICNWTLSHLPVSKKGGTKAESEVIELACSPPSSAIVAFTDGSAYGSPGPCGAGFSLRVFDGVTREFSKEGGIGTNNDGEMLAIEGVFKKMLAVPDDLLDKEVKQVARPGKASKAEALLFSDSAVCIGYLTAGWKAPVQDALARRTRALYYKCKKRFRLSLLWIRGHSNIAGNELVDKLAKEAALRVKNSMITDD